MEQLNQTTSLRFNLLGLSTDSHLKFIYFFIFLIMYLMTVSGNLMLVIVMRINPRLHSPMFFFLTNLSIIDIIFSSSVVPLLLKNTLAKDRSISVLGCSTQIFFSLGMGATESLILAFMAYDRYAAICRPLHYNTIMNRSLCISLAVVSWSVGLINSTIQAILTFQLLKFCNSRDVNHYFCEVPAFIRISCGNVFVNELSIYIAGAIIAIGCFYLIVISYVHIISKVLKIISSEGRQKSFSTCASHLTVVTLYFGTVMYMYLRPHSKEHAFTDKIVPVLYTSVTPMLNPFIYSMRNKDVKNTLMKRKQCH
ncbi:olfactory receptor-like protein OLF3 [Engystomops pustulosus]|uniref:olfactory receptor-like protein OLF3 n=1 Tax=Engystomops pustulosus TaxID=76066 RepID=UPI003AFA61CD